MPKKFTKFTVHKVISTATSKTLVAASATSDECVFCATWAGVVTRRAYAENV